MAVGLTAAQLAGLVRRAQASALSRALASGDTNSVSINNADFDLVLSEMGRSSKGNLTVELCSPYSNVYSVVNGTLARTAIVQVDVYGLIVPCLTFLLQQQGFYVKVSAHQI